MGRSSGRGRGRGRNQGRVGNRKHGPKQTTLFSNMNNSANNSKKGNDDQTTLQSNKESSTQQNQTQSMETNNDIGEVNDNSSVATNQASNNKVATTVRANEQQDLIEEEDGEDDINTVNSDQTSKRGQETQRRITVPRFIRYQLMIKLDSNNKDTPINVDENDEDKSPAQRLRDILSTLHAQMRTYDSKAMLISWKNSPDFSYLGDNFPTDIAEVAMFCNGYRSNIKADKRVYLRICIHTPNSESQLYQKMSTWCKLYGYSLTKCVIQAENSTSIGWLCYSSQYTDTDPLRSRLMEHSDFEWGFKLVSIDGSQNSLPWNKRLKAVGVYVPTEFKDIALYVIGEQLEPELNEIINIPDFTDKFLFIEPEWTTKGNKSKEAYYTKMLDRHDNHISSLKAEISYGIKVDLDRGFSIYESFDISLRDIILDLTVGNSKNDFHGDRLFHSVDYVSDSSNLWIEKKNGPGGSCVVFTYYNEVADEASTMIKGLGKFILHQHGKELAAKMLNINHFRANRGYRWNEEMGRFSTPNIRRMKANLERDNNLRSIEKLQKKRHIKEEKERKEEEERLNKENIIDSAMLIIEGNEIEGENNEEKNEDESIQSNTSDQIRRENMKQIRGEMRDPDLISDTNSSTYRDNPRNIFINDSSSVNSSITNNTNNSLETNNSFISGSTNNSNDVSLSQQRPTFKIDMKLIKTLAEGAGDNIPDSELRRQVKAIQAHKFNEAVINAEGLVEKYIQNRKVVVNNENNENKYNEEYYSQENDQYLSQSPNTEIAEDARKSSMESEEVSSKEHQEGLEDSLTQYSNELQRKSNETVNNDKSVKSNDQGIRDEPLESTTEGKESNSHSEQEQAFINSKDKETPKVTQEETQQQENSDSMSQEKKERGSTNEEEQPETENKDEPTPSGNQEEAHQVEDKDKTFQEEKKIISSSKEKETVQLSNKDEAKEDNTYTSPTKDPDKPEQTTTVRENQK